MRHTLGSSVSAIPSVVLSRLGIWNVSYTRSLSVIRPFGSPQGSIAQIFLLTAGTDRQPYKGGDLYLGRVIHGGQSDSPPFVAFSPNENIKTYSRNEETGEFVFVNVPPGEYALVLDLIVMSSAIEDPATHNFIIIHAAADQTTDVGVINVP